MEVYLIPIELSVISFVGLSIIFTIPYMLMQYIKYGSVSLIRTLILFSFFLYVLTAYYLVVLPLPNPTTVKALSGPFVQYIPFNFVFDFVKETTFRISDIGTYLSTLKQSVFIQPIFNIVLTIPFGIYLSYYFNKSFKKTLLITFLLSLFFEITQLSGFYGIYEKPYRLFDVDDLMLNTLGGILGYCIYNRFLKFLPSREKIDESNLIKSRNVGYTRRLFALGIDLIIVFLINFVVSFVLGTNIMFDLILFAYLVIFHILFKQTVGKSLVHIKLHADKYYYFRLIIRYFLLMSPLIIFNILVYVLGGTFVNSILAYLLIILLMFIFMDFVFSFSRGKNLLYERLSRTKNVSTLFK